MQGGGGEETMFKSGFLINWRVICNYGWVTSISNSSWGIIGAILQWNDIQ